MRRAGRWTLAVAAWCALVPVLMFAVGSATGDHSLRFDRTGTWLCWTPHDRMHRECLGAIPWVPVSKLDEIAPDKAGYIRCRDGHIEIGNIAISGLHMVPPASLINVDQIDCSKQVAQ